MAAALHDAPGGCTRAGLRRALHPPVGVLPGVLRRRLPGAFHRSVASADGAPGARHGGGMNLLPTLGLVALPAAVVMMYGWYWQRRRDNAGIVDVLWSACVGGSAVLLAVLGDGAWQA